MKPESVQVAKHHGAIEMKSGHTKKPDIIAATNSGVPTLYAMAMFTAAIPNAIECAKYISTNGLQPESSACNSHIATYVDIIAITSEAIPG